MSDENVRVVLEGMGAWSAGDLDRALQHIHPEIVWINSGSIPDRFQSFNDWDKAVRSLGLDPASIPA
jgi:ketosteroid isomerase-like protein